jgi:hypothetical protein
MFKFNEVFTKRQDFATSGKKINKNNSSTIGDIFNIIFGSKKVNLEIPKLKDEKKVNTSATSTASAQVKKEQKPEKAKRIKQSRLRKLSNSSVSKLTTDKDAVNEINAMFQEFIRNSKKEVRKPYYPHESYLDDEILSEGQLKQIL